MDPSTSKECIASADGDGKDTIPACTGRFLAAIC